MGVQPAAADDVAARRVQHGGAAAAGNGPASRIEPRTFAHSARSSSVSSGPGAQLDGMALAGTPPRRGRPALEHVLDVEDARDVVEDDGLSVRTQAASIGSAAFLLPSGRNAPRSSVRPG
jgi:hypothetical protein